jgi:hypothetical protein
MWRAYRTERFGWLAGIVVGWVVGFGWLVGLVFLLGPDRQRRREDAVARAQAYHPDYKRMGA